MSDETQHTEHSGTFAVVPALLLMDRDVTAGAIKVYAILASYADAQGICYPRQRWMAQTFNITQSTISEGVQRLVTKGWLERARHKRNFYRLVFQKPEEDEGENSGGTDNVQNIGGTNIVATDKNNRPVVVTDQKKIPTLRDGITDQMERGTARTRARTRAREAPPPAPQASAAFPSFAEWLHQPEQTSLRLRPLPNQQSAYNTAFRLHNWEVSREKRPAGRARLV